MKKVYLIFFTWIISLFLSINCYAANEIKVYVDNEQIIGEQPAIVENGRTLVPLKDIFNALEIDVKWNGADQTITGEKNGKTIILKINDRYAFINGERIELDVPPKIINGKTLVPLKFIAENFDADVSWNGEKRRVDIKSNLTQLFPVMKNNKYGYINNLGEIVVDFQYIDATRFYGQIAFVKDKSGKYGCINKYGELIHPFQYDYLAHQYDKIPNVKSLVVAKNGLEGLISTSGKELLPFVYADITLFTDGIAWAGKDITDSDNADLINEQGEILNSKRYDYWGFNYQLGGLLRVLDEQNRIGFIDLKGNLVVPYKYKKSFGFYNGIADVSTGGKKAAMDSKGKLLTAFKYDDVTGMGEGLIAVYYANTNKYGIINYQDKVVTKPIYDLITYFKDGRAQVSIDGKRGYIDPTGKLVIPCIYDDSGLKNDFKDGIVRVNKGGKTGFINKSGEEISPFIYDPYPYFSLQNGLSVVGLGDFYGCVDTNGKEIIPCIYDSISIYNGYVIAKKDGLYGCLDSENNIVIPFIYENIK